MNALQNILRSRASIYKVDFTQQQKKAVYRAMNDYALREVSHYRYREIKKVINEGILFIRWDNIILRVRRMALKAAKRNAQLRADTENRKIYCIRKSLVGYTLLSTKDVEYNKKIRVLGTNVDALKLAETADFIAYPKK